jgi:transposase
LAENLSLEERNMLKNGEFYSIKDMRGKGMSITQIADSLGRDRKTIRKWLDKNEPLKYQRSVTKTSILDPYKPYIKARMEEGCLNAVVLFDEIKAHGYTRANSASSFIHGTVATGCYSQSNDPL